MSADAIDRDVEKFAGLFSTMVRSFATLEKNEICCCGVTMSQCSTLMALGSEGQMTMNALSEAMSLATSTMTRIVDNLVRDGYIERGRDENDRRIVHVVLTEKGRDLFGELSQITSQYYRGIMENIRPGDRKKVLAALGVLKEAIAKVPPLAGQECCAE